ncbi:hypothetical protein AB1Y20_013169 [Prymnesium parvum]|uniref:Peptidase S49 domain-containing protein n=1 Tax=Prymnesium parvum TaxID=97485 RepID=A0AB34IKX8_PRYPA
MAALLLPLAAARLVPPLSLPPLSLGPPRRAPLPSPPPPANSSAFALDLLKRDLFFYERLCSLLLTAASRLLDTAKRLLSRLLHFPPRVFVVSLQGVVAADDEAARLSLEAFPPHASSPSSSPSPSAARPAPPINLARAEPLLARAFRGPGVRAVCLLINSPGGSPAQSSLIYERLRALRAAHRRVPLLAFVEDSACSGGYYIACAADEIIADPSSVVGSIGVITRGFGYVKAIKKEGLTRRVHAAGAAKGGLDPFLDERRGDLRQQRRLLHEIHANFIAAVRQGRGARLKPEAAAALTHRTLSPPCLPFWSDAPSPRRVRQLVREGAGLFDGTVYSGAVGVEVGLVDKVGEMRTELRRRYGRFVRIEQVEPERIDYSRLLRFLL